MSNASDASPPAPPTAGTRPRVLLAEDEPALRRAFTRALESRGAQVTAAKDGRDAAALLASTAFDAIVSDIAMPYISGIELLRTVRAHDPDVPVILLTGVPDVATAVQAVEYGAFKYLTKPVDLALLEQTVARAIQLHGMARIKREALALAGAGALGAADGAALEASFQRALDGLWMAYQPIVRVADRGLFGYEALLRSTEAALPHPGAVLDAAERLNRLPELGRAARAAAAGPIAADEGRGVLFVNLHAIDLLDDTLLSAAEPLGALAHRVVLEITERASLSDVSDARARVSALRRMGFRIAIDDLGAGYAGLTSFATLEPEIVKLDMSLVRDIDKSATKQKLVRSVTTLCREMGMLVVAEGVETADERDALVALECDLLQGYLIARPGRPFPAHGW
jgi:EAL domain-containing protein (putative c-di-GMP-specific phosphodiesterase class I)